MDSWTRKRFLLVVLCLVGGLIIFAIGFVKKLASPRSLAIGMLLLMVTMIIILWMVFAKCAERRKLGLEVIPVSTDRKKLQRSIAWLKFNVVFFPVVLVYASWETRGGPIAPRLVGIIMNLLITFGLFRALQQKQSRLKVLDSEK
jgi:hypothetical protein